MGRRSKRYDLPQKIHKKHKLAQNIKASINCSTRRTKIRNMFDILKSSGETIESMNICRLRSSCHSKGSTQQLATNQTHNKGQKEQETLQMTKYSEYNCFDKYQYCSQWIHLITLSSSTSSIRCSSSFFSSCLVRGFFLPWPTPSVHLILWNLHKSEWQWQRIRTENFW